MHLHSPSVPSSKKRSPAALNVSEHSGAGFARGGPKSRGLALGASSLAEETRNIVTAIKKRTKNECYEQNGDMKFKCCG